MVKVAQTDEAIAARLKLFQHGVPEEFYDYEKDPDALHNLIDDPAYADELAEHRAAMRDFMKQSNDPMLAVFDKRDDAQAVSAYVDRVQAESDARRKAKLKNRPAKRKQNQRLFQLVLPKQAAPGGEFTVTVRHKLPKQLGEQQFHVTLKDAAGKRIERIVKPASGAGDLKVTFKLAEDLPTKKLSVSAFVGKDYPSNLLHRTVGPVAVSSN